MTGRRSVVVTGIGIVSSIGNNAQEVTQSLRDAKSGIVAASKYKELGFRSQVEGHVNIDLDAAGFELAHQPTGGLRAGVDGDAPGVGGEHLGFHALRDHGQNIRLVFV